MKKIANLVFILLSTTLIWAQEDKPLTLQECIEIALRNNSTLRVAKNRYDIAGSNVTIAYSNLLPRLNMSLGSGKYIQGARVLKLDVPAGYDTLTGRVIYEQQEIYQKSVERNSHYARLSFNQNIFDFGQTIYNIKLNKAQQQANQLMVQNTKQLVILNVKQAYYELLKAMRLLEVYQEAVRLAEEEFNRSQAMLNIGLTSQAELLQARVSLGNARSNLITQKNVVEVAKANLNNALGRDPSTAVDVIEDESEPIFPSITLEEALQKAIQNNPDLKALELQAKSSLYSMRMAQTRYMPSIGANISYSRNNDDIGRVYSEKLDQDFSASIGIGLDLNIFNGLADKAAVQKSYLTYQIDQENLRERKRTLIAEVKQYFLQFSAYKEFLEINQQNIEAAKENLRLQQEKRRVGSGTELEVTQAQVELTRAQANLVRAEYDAKIAKAQLETAMGIEVD